MDYSVFQQRIKKVQSKLESDDLLILFAASHKIRNRDVEYKFRQDSDFYYLTGIEEHDSILVLSKNYSCMFCLPKNKDEEIWTGIRLGRAKIKKYLNLDEAFDISEWEKTLPNLLSNKIRLFYFFGKNSIRDTEIIQAVEKVSSRSRDGKFGPEKIEQPSFLHEMRLIKTQEEIQILKEAARITFLGHSQLFNEAKAGMMEYELEGILEKAYLSEGAWGGGYGHIVASGKNACILHYVSNNAMLKNGDIVLVDSGAEIKNYTADVTRCFPVSNKFSDAQAHIYQLVLAAQKNAISMVQSGRPFYDIQNVTIRFFVDCLIDLGILEGSIDKNIESGEYKRFYMHKIGHYLGMDVHDVGKYYIQGKNRALVDGMIVTIEPGLYFDPDDKTIPKEFRGIGIRIEDDILVSGKKPINLTEAIPKELSDIEEIRAFANS
ncbi:aminopeptidase P N-terminal domain-containing protein [Leptospira sp. GIMC2001]|nr:aminopeptidase P N-terminal domain-containing protein [Leptospira sp. GIMC2001]WCL51350.1 aminopeptidase P N-terminal domain-containing protein [Leptospira sp. GIMC2001]